MWKHGIRVGRGGKVQRVRGDKVPKVLHSSECVTLLAGARLTSLEPRILLEGN